MASACSSFALTRSRCCQPLGDDHELGEEVVGELDVQRQVEADGALADIGAPMVHVLIARQELVHPGRDIPRCVDRRVLRQLQIHQQLRPVRGREELLRNETHAVERRAEQAERREQRHPARPHRQHQEAAEHAHDRAGLAPSAPPWAS